jgi:hypothetical protein
MGDPPGTGQIWLGAQHVPFMQVVPGGQHPPMPPPGRRQGVVFAGQMHVPPPHTMVGGQQNGILAAGEGHTRSMKQHMLPTRAMPAGQRIIAAAGVGGPGTGIGRRVTHRPRTHCWLA